MNIVEDGAVCRTRIFVYDRYMEGDLIGLLYDVRQVLRELIRSPGFLLASILVLGLGIGINAAVYGVVFEVLVRPLPFVFPGRVVQVEVPAPISSDSNVYGESWADLQDWRAQSTSFEQIAGLEGATPQNLRFAGGAYEVSNVQGTANLLDVFGVAPLLGRTMQAREDALEGVPPIVLSAQAWHNMFGSDAGVLGRKIFLQGRPHIIIGVMPPGFSFPAGEGNQVWTPTDLDLSSRANRGIATLQIIGRLRPSVSLAQARVELSTIQFHIAHAYADLHLGDHVLVTRYHNYLTARYRPALLALQAAVGVVWLNAFINVAGLMLTRGVSRRFSIVIRGVLGASRPRIVQQFLAESVLLSTFGGVAGLAMGAVTIRFLHREIARLLPLSRDLHLHLQPVGVLFALTVLSGLIIGTVPAWQATHAPVHEVIRTGSSMAGNSLRQRHLGDALVVGQIAMSVLLMVVAGLLLRTVYSLHHVALGFVADNVISGSLIFPEKMYDSNDINSAVFEPLLQRVKQVPGVQSAAISSVLPMRSEFSMEIRLTILSREGTDFADQPHGDLRLSTAGMTEALGVRMLRGRFFNENDTASSRSVAVVNQSFASRYFFNEDPLSHELGMGRTGRFADVAIIGVVDNMKQIDLEKATEPEIYICAAQVTPGTSFYAATTAVTQLAVRTLNNPESAIPAVRRILREVAPDAVFGEVKTLHAVVEDSIGSQKLAAALLEISAATALVISLVGLYALLLHSVNQRIREIGVRLTLGAQRSSILRLVMNRAAALVGAGLTIGSLLGLMFGRVIRSFLFGVRPNDVGTMVIIWLLFAACGFLASYGPARRAASVDPIRALRSE